MTRRQTAFIVAPLWVPLLVTPISAVYIFPYAAQFAWVIITGTLSVFFAYFGAYVLGWPLFNLLTSRNFTGLGTAIVSGCSIAILTWFAFMICFVMFLGEGFDGIGMVIHFNIIQMPGIPALGALVGGTLWIIARPDLTRGR